MIIDVPSALIVFTPLSKGKHWWVMIIIKNIINETKKNVTTKISKRPDQVLSHPRLASLQSSLIPQDGIMLSVNRTSYQITIS